VRSGERRKEVAVPQIVFSDEEKAAIEAVVAEFDPEYHGLTQNLRTILSEDDWAFVVQSLRKTLRREVEGAIARPVVEEAVDFYDRTDADPKELDRLYHLYEATEENNPLPGEWTLDYGRSPLAAAHIQLIDGAEEAVKGRVAAA
jgi:hypothetical protein